MKVAIAPHLSGDDIVIGSLNEILAAGVAPTMAMQKRLSRPVSRGLRRLRGCWEKQGQRRKTLR